MSATDSDAFGRCKWCGNMTDSAGCLNITCASRTPPTPDPRERGEDAWTIVRKALLDACAVDRNPLHKYEHVSARLDAIAAQCADRVLALRAPAPSEAVAWTLSAPMLGGVSALATFLSDSEEDAIKRASAGQPLEGWTVTPLYTHPAPARGVTVLPSEALFGFMGWLTSREAVSGPFSGAQNATQAADLVAEFCRSQGWEFPRDSFPKMLTNYPVAALTPDAEGGA